MKYPLYMFCLLILLSCKSRRDFVEPHYEIITEYIHFDRHDSITHINRKYNLTEKYVAPNHYELWQNDKLFYKRNNKGNNTLYEVYKARFLLISYFPIFADGYTTTERDSVYMYDFETEKGYNLLAKRYILAPFRTTPPRFNEAIIKKLKKENVTLHATIDAIDLDNNLMVVLLGDLKTRDTVVLQPLIK
jgi:hypothetical protein